jgi:hypothetical protein
MPFLMTMRSLTLLPTRLPHTAPRLAACGLIALLMPACSSEPPRHLSADEEALRAENKATEHRVFYSGWLHPGDN